MSAINKVKKLLAAASPGPMKAMVGVDGRMRLAYYDEAAEDFVYLAEFHVDSRVRDANVANAQLAALARAWAKALVESQEALEKVAQVECDDLIHFSLVDDPENCDPACIRCPVEAALRMNGLEKAMEG